MAFDDVIAPAQILAEMAELRRRKAEWESQKRLLEEKVERFELLAKNTNDIVYRLNIHPVPHFEYVSPAVLDITGYSPDEFYTRFNLYAKMVGKEKWRELVVRFENGKLDRRAFIQQWQRKDGGIAWLEVITIPVFDELMNIESIEGVARDITEQKITELALLENEAKYRELVEGTGEFIARFDPLGNFTFANSTVEKILNTEKAGCLAKPLTDFVHPDDREKTKDAFNRWIEDKRKNASFENRIMSLNGQEYLMQWKINLHYDENESLKSINAIARDITLEKDILIKLKNSEERYRRLIEWLPEGVLVIHDFNIVYANPFCLKILGIDENTDLKGMNFKELLHPDFKENALSLVQKLSECSLHSEVIEERLMKIDGVMINVEISNQPITYEGKSSILTLIKDVTEKKLLEENENKLKEKLKRAERLESLSILAGGVAHDLNNIIGPIMGYPDLMLSEIPDDSPLLGLLQQIKMAAHRAAEVISDLLTLARRGKYTMNPVDLNHVLSTELNSHILKDLKSKFPNVKLKISLSRKKLNISGSSSHLQKMVMNLLYNAFESIENDGYIKIDTSKRYLETLPEKSDKIVDGDYAVLEIEDNGEGIPKDKIDLIFDPFFTTKKKTERSGTGLGLSVVYGVIEDHAGYIDVQSKEGHGTKFIIYFPTTEIKISEAPSEPVDITGKEIILVVDDVENQRVLAERLLKSIGYKVNSVSNGYEAVEYLKNNNADLVLLDMIMGDDMDGLDTYRRILEINKSQKAIIASGFSETDRVKNARKLGVGDYVRKPYTLETLGKSVRKELDKI